MLIFKCFQACFVQNLLVFKLVNGVWEPNFLWNMSMKFTNFEEFSFLIKIYILLQNPTYFCKIPSFSKVFEFSSIFLLISFFYYSCFFLVLNSNLIFAQKFGFIESIKVTERVKTKESSNEEQRVRGQASAEIMKMKFLAPSMV